MTNITYKGTSIVLDPGESVLDALIRNEQDVQFGCKAGHCQSCMLIADKGVVPKHAQKGLSENQIRSNYFLSCQCKPEADMHIASDDSINKVTAVHVIEKLKLGNNVLRIRLEYSQNFNPGQYVMVWKTQHLGRCYSIASQPSDGMLELHIRLYENGAVSSWFANEISVGDQVNISAPSGLCYLGTPLNKPILLIGSGTGLAPLYGILNQALSQDRRAPIRLIIANRSENDFYYINELRSLQQRHKNFSLDFVAQSASSADYFVKDIYEYCKNDLPTLKDWHVYLCGAENFVTKLRKITFLKGANMQDIHSDSFVPFN